MCGRCFFEGDYFFFKTNKKPLAFYRRNHYLYAINLVRVVSSAGRASRLHRGGRGFEPLTTHHLGLYTPPQKYIEALFALALRGLFISYCSMELHRNTPKSTAKWGY